jgi:S-DNA-T family DNA segregation ATPase FtsK/SpoIIIE
VRAELDRRLEALRRAGYRDIWEWLDADMPEWPLILVVVDELAELTVRELGSDKVGRAAQQAAIGRLTEIARLARAAGIFLVLATQRPDAEAVHGQLKANLAGTVAFRTRAMVNSMILLDNDRASVLPPHPGRAIWSHDRDEEFQGIRLEGDESRRLLEQRWGAKLLRQPTVPVTPWVQTPQEDASAELDANSEQSA